MEGAKEACCALKREIVLTTILEFYVYLTGNRLLNERMYGVALHELGQQLSPKAGLHVEFKIDSLSRMRRSPVAIFTHDLVASHRLLFGEEGIFDSCEHHLQSEDIPLSEASHLLLNRCSGLLLAREILLDADRFAALAPEQTDFVGRNLAKAQLCLGDAILVAFRRHHWSCTQRHLRLHHLVVPEPLPWL